MSAFKIREQTGSTRSQRTETNGEFLEEILKKDGRIICRLQLQVYNPADSRYAGLKDAGVSFEATRAEDALAVWQGIQMLLSRWGQ